MLQDYRYKELYCPVLLRLLCIFRNKRDELSLSKENFIIENVTDDHKFKLPGSINGQQFMIQFCTNSYIYVFDFTNTVTIDDCTHCTIVVGPVKRRLIWMNYTAFTTCYLSFDNLHFLFAVFLLETALIVKLLLHLSSFVYAIAVI